MNEQEKEQFIEIIDSIKELRLKKSADYGSSWKIWGLEGILWQIKSKFIRLINLTNKNKTPQNEPIRDTLIDMANYCIMGVQLLDSEKTDSIMDELINK